jgi:phage-related protein
MKFIEDCILDKKEENKTEAINVKAQSDLLDGLLSFVLQHRRGAIDMDTHLFSILDAWLFNIPELITIFDVRKDFVEKFSNLIENRINGIYFKGQKYYSLFEIIESAFLVSEIAPLTYYYSHAK